MKTFFYPKQIKWEPFFGRGVFITGILYAFLPFKVKRRGRNITRQKRFLGSYRSQYLCSHQFFCVFVLRTHDEKSNPCNQYVERS